MLSFLTKFQHRREIRESKDEILVGEIVFIMAHMGYPAIGFFADNDRQAVTFKPRNNSLLHTVTIILDRKTGSGALQQALIGSRATVTIQAEIKNYLSDPDDLIHMYKTDLQNLFKIPILGNVRLDHQLNSVLATTHHLINIDDHILKGADGRNRLQQLLTETITNASDKLAPYKKTRPA